mgnify:CR=1 FL=1
MAKFRGVGEPSSGILSSPLRLITRTCFPPRVSNSIFYFQFCALLAILLDLPILRPVMGSLYISLVPGLAMLYLMDQQLDYGIKILCSVGLSIGSVMLTVATMNVVLPQIGISNPIEFQFVLASIVFIVSGLALAIRSSNDGQLAVRETGSILRSIDFRYLLLGTFLPLISIVGTYHLLNKNGVTAVNILLMILLAIFPIVISLHKQKTGTGFLIWVISITLLLDVNLVSEYIWGWDIHKELYLSSQVLESSQWNVGYRSNINTMLPYATLAPTYSLVLGFDLVWVFKLIYPLLFSFVPVGIYYMIKSVSNHRVAALAPFPFIFYYGFFKSMPHKQYLAEIFIVLLLIVAFSDNIRGFYKRTLLLGFGAALITTHYGSAFFTFALIGGAIALSFLFESKEQRSPSYLFRIQYLILVIVLFGFWYTMVGGGIMAQHITIRAITTLHIIPELLSSPPGRSGSGYASRGSSSPVWVLYRVLSIALVGMIGFGIFYETQKWIRQRFSTNPSPILESIAPAYLSLGIGSFALVSASAIITFGMGFDRIFQYSLVILSPFFLLGLKAGAENLPHIPRPHISVSTPIIAAIFLTIYFLFSSGVLFLGVAGSPLSYALAVDADSEWNVYSDAEVEGANWINENLDTQNVSAMGEQSRFKQKDILLLYGIIGPNDLVSSPPDKEISGDIPIIYYGDKPLQGWWDGALEGSVAYNQSVHNHGRIYDNGVSETFYN